MDRIKSKMERMGKNMKVFCCALVAACVLASTVVAVAQEQKTAPELVVAAAADLSSALQEISDGYEKKTGDRSEAIVRSIRRAHAADSEWRAIRSILFGGHGLSRAS